MKPDYKRFTINREIFPRDLEYDSNGQICGHLNRVKFPTDVSVYLKNRKEGKGMSSSLAIANRCRCRQELMPKDPIKEELKRIEIDFDESKNLIHVIENIEIVLPKEKKKEKK